MREEMGARGVGMSGGESGETTGTLTVPPLLDLSGSEQLGLFIAGQLARRHEVKISMRGSAYGGVIAVVLIPSTLVIDAGYGEPLKVIGLRELGGRPVPQLPAIASGTDAEVAGAAPSAADADHLGSPC